MQDEFAIFPISEVHSDERRTLYEADIPLGEVKRERVFLVHDGGSIGPAYHRDFFETFILPGGAKAILTVQRVDEKGSPHGDRSVHHIEEPSIIRMPPRTAHHLQLQSEGAIICLGQHPFDPDEHIKAPWLMDA